MMKPAFDDTKPCDRQPRARAIDMFPGSEMAPSAVMTEGTELDRSEDAERQAGQIL